MSHKDKGVMKFMMSAMVIEPDLIVNVTLMSFAFAFGMNQPVLNIKPN